MQFEKTARPILLGLLALVLLVPVASAQEMPIPENVTQLADPNLNAEGLPLGSFRLYPKLLILGGYDTNILATENSTIEAGRTTVLPSVLVESQWSRHELSFATFLESRLYPYESQENYLDWGFGSKGRLDIKDTTNLGGSINYQRLTEDRSGIDALTQAPDPSQYGQFDVNAVFNHTFDQLTASLGASYTNLDYLEDNQSFRNRGLTRGTARLGYIFSPGYSVFAQGTVNNRDYFNRDTRIAGNPYQDSTGYDIGAGISSTLTNLITGELWVGYLEQYYTSSVFKDVKGVSFGANVTWFATPLTTVNIHGGREVVDATTGTAGGIFYSTAGLDIEHDVLDDLVLNAGFEYYNGDYIGISRDDDGWRVNAGVLYMLNRYVGVEVNYTYDNRDSNVAGQSFDRNQVDFGFEFQL